MRNTCNCPDCIIVQRNLIEPTPKLTLTCTVLPSWAVPAVRNRMGKGRCVLYICPLGCTRNLCIYSSLSPVSPSPLSLPLSCFSLSPISPSPLSLPLPCLSLSPVSLSPFLSSFSLSSSHSALLLSFHPLPASLPPLPPLFLRRPLMRPCQH